MRDEPVDELRRRADSQRLRPHRKREEREQPEAEEGDDGEAGIEVGADLPADCLVLNEVGEASLRRYVQQGGAAILTLGPRSQTLKAVPVSGQAIQGAAVTGKVGEGSGLVSADDAKGYARACALNALAAVRAELGSLDRITRVVKLVGFVASDPSFTGQPGVVNGASEVLGEIFGDAGRHARSAVGVAVLPLDAPVEVELVVEFA